MHLKSLPTQTIGVQARLCSLAKRFLLLTTLISSFGTFSPVLAESAPMAPPETEAPKPLSLTGATDQSATESTLKIGTATERIPSGSFLKIALNTAMDSRISQNGEPFTAYVAEDFMGASIDGEPKVILPVGTVVRGRLSQVKKPSILSRGGSIVLGFDHVMMPSGDLLPLNFTLSATHNTIVNQKGALYSDPGIGPKVKKSMESGASTFEKIKDAGFKAGQNTLGGVGMLVAAPVSLAGGALAGTAVTTGKATVAIVGRGESVILKPGDILTIDFAKAATLQAQ